jgi:hypothetical protein
LKIAVLSKTNKNQLTKQLWQPEEQTFWYGFLFCVEEG